MALVPPQFFYAVDPIDFWDGWMDKSAFLLSLIEEDDEPPPSWLTVSQNIARKLKRSQEILGAFEVAAKVVAPLIGWEGDIREGPYFSVLPGNSRDNNVCVPIIMAFKHNNNGTTFIASSYELPWLQEDAMGTFRVGDAL